jgi:hypothetical protein
VRQDRSRLTVVLAVGAALLLLFAVVAAATRGRNPFGHPQGGTGPSAQFVSYAWTTVLTVAVLVLVTGLVFAFRGPKVSSPQTVRKRRHWSTILLFGFLLLALLIRAHRAPVTTGTHEIGRDQKQPKIGRLQPPEPQSRADFRWDAFGAIVGAAAVVAALAVIAARRRGGGRPWVELGPPESETALALSDALDDSLDDLRSEPDLRKAVIAAYARMERTLAGHGFARARWETPLEYMARVLGGLAGSRDPVTRLTALFEQAKFSGHRPAPAMREEAIDALVVLRDDLRRAADVRAEPAPAAP